MRDSRQVPSSGSFPGGDLAPDTLVGGRYRILRRLARGGMASVYLARHEQLDRLVALKVFRPAEEDEAAFAERFLLEARTLAALDHPHIVRVYDYGEVGEGATFLAMEYVDGRRATELLRAGPLPVQRAVGLVVQVCEALAYAHARGVVHRDIKLSNILVMEDEEGRDRVKVVDFGLVKVAEREQDLTQAGLILGSPHFMAPEQVKGEPVDARTDVYAVGVLLYCTLTGMYPFHGEQSHATMAAHLTRRPPRFSKVAPELDLPDDLERVVRRCLRKDPVRRFGSMEDLLAALRPFAPQPAGDSLGSVATIRLPPPSPWRRALPFVLGAAILVAVGVLLLRRPAPAPAEAPRAAEPAAPDAAGPALPARGDLAGEGVGAPVAVEPSVAVPTDGGAEVSGDAMPAGATPAAGGVAPASAPAPSAGRGPRGRPAASPPRRPAASSPRRPADARPPVPEPLPGEPPRRPADARPPVPEPLPEEPPPVSVGTPVGPLEPSARPTGSASEAPPGAAPTADPVGWEASPREGEERRPGGDLRDPWSED